MLTIGRRWRNTSAHVALVASCLVVAILIGAGVLVENRLVGSLIAEARNRAQQTADELVDEFVREGLGGLKESIVPRLHGGERRLRYALVGRGGEILVGDASLCRLVPGCVTDPAARSSEARTIDPVVISRPLDQGDRTILLVVADDLAILQDIKAIIARCFWYAVAAAVLAGAASGYVLSRYLLGQLGTINAAADAIVSGDLSRRIPTHGSGDEFEELRRTLNRMLERITGLLANVHQVSTDIAHDLRTPLSRLRHKLEIARSDDVTREELRRTLDAAVHDLDQVLETFAALLRIAQIESGQRRAAFRTLDLSAILADVFETYEAVAEEGGRRLTSRLSPGLAVCGDRELIVQMMCNIVENALVHTPHDAHVALDLASVDGAPVITVRDNGHGIARVDLPLVFRRFYRGERSRSTPGTGLGLSLVAAVVDLHGGTIELADGGPGLRTTIRFPPATRDARPVDVPASPLPARLGFQESIQAPAE